MADKKPTYWELLKHPNWQRKRLEILERDGFTCEDCGSAEKSLNVHHTYYERGKKPWEYPSGSLHSLCDECHEKAQNWMDLLHRQIGSMPLYHVETLLGFALGLAAMDSEEAMEAPILVHSHGMAVGLAHVFHTNAGFIISNIRDGMIDGMSILKAVSDYHDSVKRRTEEQS